MRQKHHLKSNAPAKRKPLFAMLACAGVGVLLVAILGAAKNDSRSETKSIFANRTAAKNPTDLIIVPDQEKVLGWITGDKSFTGREVTITLDGQKYSAMVQQDNTFTWHHNVSKPHTATFKVGDFEQTARLEPAAAGGKTAFFVVDRTVYRPEQRMQFAGFLRHENAKREFVPLANKEVVVQIRSAKKKTLAAKIKTTSDEFGRVTGEYQFHEADALDRYTLQIEGFTGSAEVKLAEFRKAKVRLKIDGELDGDELKLSFQAVDFLDKPVPGSKIRFTAQIVKNSEQNDETALNAAEFLYPHNSGGAFDPSVLSEDERLLWEAGVTTFATPRRAAATLVAQREGDVQVGKEGHGDYTLALEPAWTRGAYRVVVEGVLTDYNGREQRAKRVLPIGTEVNDCDLELHLAKKQFTTSEEIRLDLSPTDKDGKPIAATTTVMAMRLAPSTAVNFSPYQYGHYGYGYRQNYRRFSGQIWSARRQSPRWNVIQAAESGTPRRTLVTATVARDNVATFKIDQPGPYKLVCIAELPDGRKLKNEVGCIVRKQDEMPGVVLQLEQEDFRAGDLLTGAIHSRFNDARVLLTVRDSRGVRFWKIFTVADGVASIREPLPPGLKYGCVVEIQYLDAPQEMFVAGRKIRVEPVDRIVKVDIKTDAVFSPGEEVVLNLDVNRKDEVDLVVSVFDQSLLGVAADRGRDIRNYYLADERVFATAGREILRRRLGNVTVKELIEKAEQLFKEDASLANTPDGQHLRQAINYYRKSRYLNLASLEVLLSLAGIDVTPAQPHFYGWNWYYQFNANREEKDPIAVVELLSHRRNQWQVQTRMLNDTLVFAEWHPNQIVYYNNSVGPVLGNFGYAMRAGRADAQFSLSANSMLSHNGGMVSGQSFISHVPVAGPPIQLIDADQTDVAVRRDFSDSAFWNAQVRTDASGHATVKFKLPDSLTNWQVVVTAVSKDMHVGQARSSFRTFKPVMVWPMVPRIFTEGDKVRLYASVHNRTDKPQEMEVSLKVKNGVIHSPRIVHVTVPAKSNVPVYWTYQPEQPGYAQLLMTAKCAAGSDASLKRLPVAQMAVEQVVTLSGFARDGATLVVPSDANLKDAELHVTFVPTLVDDLLQSLDYLVQYPHGCVEQTMSRFLPAIKVAQTLKRANIENAALEKKLPGVVEAGVKRLLQLQREDGGWGWHNGSQTHEMMTPYALYGLLQAEKAGYDIRNANAVQSGVNRLRQFINAMNEKQSADRIYCMYVYSHRNKLTDDDWKFVIDQLGKDKLSDYALAMSLEMAVAAKKTDLGDRLAAALHRRVKRTPETAYWTTAGFSRWGNDRLEITAAVLKALAAHNPENELIAPILSYFATTKRGNRWNSTKSTAMIIYAMCDYLATQDYKAGVRRVVEFTANGGKPHVVQLTDGLQPKITIAGRHLKSGNNSLRFDGHVPGAMYRAVFRYWQRREKIMPLANGVSVKREFFLLDGEGNRQRQIASGERVPRGAYLESVVTVKHSQNDSMRYVLVENPKPATCEIVPETDTRFKQNSTAYALREDKTAGVAYHHEQTGGQIVDRCVLHAELAGEFLVPPAKVELMYETLTRGHSGAFQFVVEDSDSKVATR